MQNKSNLIISVIFFLTFIIHFAIWKFVFHLDEVTIIKFYLFLTIIFMMMITLIILINKILPQYLGFAMIGLIVMKFGLMFLVKNKLHFEAIPNYKFHFIIPYFILTTLLTYYAIQLINYDKKQ